MGVQDYATSLCRQTLIMIKTLLRNILLQWLRSRGQRECSPDSDLSIKSRDPTSAKLIMHDLNTLCIKDPHNKEGGRCLAVNIWPDQRWLATQVGSRFYQHPPLCENSTKPLFAGHSETDKHQSLVDVATTVKSHFLFHCREMQGHVTKKLANVVVPSNGGYFPLSDEEEKQGFLSEDKTPAQFEASQLE